MAQFDRRSVLKYGSAGLAAGMLPSSASAQAPAPKVGGSAVVAMSAATETVDPHLSRSQAARNVLMHMYESLVTIDERAAPQLQLAEALESSPDSRTYTFTLRKGVAFHNGKEMTSADVKASLERYARVSPEKVRLANVDRITTPDPHRVVVELKTSQPSWIELIKSPASPMTIIPSEESEKDANKISNIATGPFEFVEWDGVSRLRLRRNKNYKPNTAYQGAEGYGGRRTPYLDEVTFNVVTEASSRVAGLQSGQYHVVDNVPVPAAERLKSDARFRVYDRVPVQMNLVPVNVTRAPTDKLLVRRAIQQALDNEEIMEVAAEGAYKLSPAFVYPDSPFYPKDAAKLVYNARNPDRAKALLKEAGYNGEEVVILTSADIPSLKEVGVVMGEQLKAIGMKVRIDVLDWPGANARRADPNSYNLFSTAFAIQPMLGPFQYQRLISGPDNWFYYKEDAVMDGAWQKLLAASSPAAQAESWATIERHLNEQVYLLKMGDKGIKQMTAASVQNFKPFDATRMWDVWLA